LDSDAQAGIQTVAIPESARAKADLELKQRALDRTVPTDGEPGRYRPPDDIIDFLDRL
jgi:hypothetical protein